MPGSSYRGLRTRFNPRPYVRGDGLIVAMFFLVCNR